MVRKRRLRRFGQLGLSGGRLLGGLASNGSASKPSGLGFAALKIRNIIPDHALLSTGAAGVTDIHGGHL
jgi:hypothetical protein